MNVKWFMPLTLIADSLGGNGVYPTRHVKWFIPLALIAGFSSNGCRDQPDDAVPAATSTLETEESASQFGFSPDGGNIRRGDPREGRPDRPQRPEMEE